MSKKPNILLITSDQQHFDTLGVTNPRIKTPALDRLCREGTRFTQGVLPKPCVHAEPLEYHHWHVPLAARGLDDWRETARGRADGGRAFERGWL